MKKRNLLSLSALVLSLGLVVTSCAGTPGAEGKPGAEGPQGPQGEKGEPGEPGKTYIDVITRDWNWSATGSVKQDKYAVEAGKNETVTFTFTAKDDADNLVVDVKINDVVVADVVEPNEEGELEFTLIVDETYQSVQLTAATFTNVQDYGQLLLQNAGKAITDADKGINLSHSGEGEDPVYFLEQGNGADVKPEYVTNEYSGDATTAVQEVYDDAEEAVNKAYEKAVKEHKDDIKAQLAAIKEAANAEVTKINDAYKTAIDDAKLAAKDNLEDLMDEVSNDAYTDDDKTAQKGTFSGQIDTVETIENLGKVISGALPSESHNASNPAANNFVFLKNMAFGEIEDAVAAVAEYDDDLEDEDTLAKLKEWGVETTELPEGIAKEHREIVSAATEIKYVAATSTDVAHTDLGRAAEEAITGAIDDIKETVVASVKEKYHKEINESAALADSDATKTALIGVVDTAISNFVNVDETITGDGVEHLSLSQYVSTDVKNSWINTNGNTIIDANKYDIGLIGYVEYCLAKPVNTSVNTAFAAEREQKARTEALASLKAKRAEIKDSAYTSLTSYSKIRGNDAKVSIASDKVGKGTITGTVVNPFFKNITVGTDNKVTADAQLAKVSETKDADYTVGGNVLTDATFNLDDYYKLLETALKAETRPTDSYGTLYIQEWANKHLNDFNAIYFCGLDTLHTALTGEGTDANPSLETSKNTGVKGSVNTSGLKGTWGTTDGGKTWAKNNGDAYDMVDVSEIVGPNGKWTKLDITVTDTSPSYNDVNGISEYADGVADNLEALVALNEGLAEWLKLTVEGDGEDIAAKDPSYLNHFKEGATVSGMKKEFDAKLDAALKGELSESAAKNWAKASNLNKVYEADVAAYLEVAKDIILERKQEVASQADDVKEKLKIEANYATLTSAIGKYVVSKTNGADVSKTDLTTWKLVDEIPEGLTVGTKCLDFTCKTITSVDAWFAQAKTTLTK